MKFNKLLILMLSILLFYGCSTTNNDGNSTTTSTYIAGPNVTDIDGNTYQSVTNCGLTFTKQNLNVSKYTDGTVIPQVTDVDEWSSLTKGAWCYLGNDTANGTVYGKLYNWYAVAGIYDDASAFDPSLRKQLAPQGWHIPTTTEWLDLINCLDPTTLGNSYTAGFKMKETGTSHWQAPNFEATNISGFTGLPSGSRYHNGYNFGFDYSCGGWWSSTQMTQYPYLKLYPNNGFAFMESVISNRVGFAVRCIKD
jgi:uncharacterized protein (TIGR02145 family)